MRATLVAASVLFAGCDSHRLPTEPRETSQSNTTETIRAECRAAADGDWDAWQSKTAAYRADLKRRVDDVGTIELLWGNPAVMTKKVRPLAGFDNFYLFEVDAKDNLVHLYDSASLDDFRKDKKVVAAHRWLKARGIDLIFVPVPKMTDIYVEKFVKPCPEDGIIAPHVRRALLELAEADVEVVDCFHHYRERRSQDCLYNTADPHWAPDAIHIAAREVARRIERYPFGADAVAKSPITKTVENKYDIYSWSPVKRGPGIPDQSGWALLTKEQKRLSDRYQPLTHNQVRGMDDKQPPNDPESPIMLIGHSYCCNFQEQLVRVTNLRVRSNWGAGQTTEAFADFVREPELLEGCKVVVWIATTQHLTHFKAMPPEVMATLR